MFRAPLCPSSGALSNCSRRLRFPYKCRVGCVSMFPAVVCLLVGSQRRCSTCFGHHYAHLQALFQTAVAASGFRINAEVDVLPAVVGLLVGSHRRCSTCFGYHYAHHQELFQTAVAASGLSINAEVDVFPAVVGLLVGSHRRCSTCFGHP
jgi:small basic protein